MRFWLGSHLRLAEKDLLRHLRLRSSINPLRCRVRHDSGFMVFGCADLRAADGQSAILPYKSQIDNEEDTECKDVVM